MSGLDSTNRAPSTPSMPDISYWGGSVTAKSDFQMKIKSVENGFLIEFRGKEYVFQGASKAGKFVTRMMKEFK